MQNLDNQGAKQNKTELNHQQGQWTGDQACGNHRKEEEAGQEMEKEEALKGSGQILAIAGEVLEMA